MEGNLKIINLELPYDQLGKIGLNYLGENIGELIILDGLKISKDFCVNLWKLPAGQKIKKEGLGITGLSKLSSSEMEDIYIVKKRPTKLTLLLEKYGLYY